MQLPTDRTKRCDLASRGGRHRAGRLARYHYEPSVLRYGGLGQCGQQLVQALVGVRGLAGTQSEQLLAVLVD
jgi:hypothetical protein